MNKTDPYKGKCVIMLGYTPNNAISIGSILKYFEGYRIYCFLSCSRNLVSYENQVSWLSLNSDKTFVKIFSFLKTSAQLKVILARYSETSVCLSHPDHIIGNYLFFHPRVSRRYIYEDGTLNYYDAVRSEIECAKMLRRARYSWLIGLPCRSYEGLISGVDAKSYDGAFLSMPDKAVKPERLGYIRKISRYSRSALPLQTEDCVLFLDQEIESFLVPAQVKELREKLEDFLANFDGKVLVKSHYSMSDSRKFRHARQISAVDSKLPAELLIEKLRPSIVVSFTSSALVNIQALYPEVRCVAIGANQFPLRIDGKVSNTAQLLEGLGVQTVEV